MADRLSDEHLRTITRDRVASAERTAAMAAELLAARAGLATATKALDKIARRVRPDEDGTWTDCEGLLESIGNTVAATGRKVWEE
jgi:hypothetical protein